MQLIKGIHASVQPTVLRVIYRFRVCPYHSDNFDVTKVGTKRKHDKESKPLEVKNRKRPTYNDRNERDGNPNKRRKAEYQRCGRYRSHTKKTAEQQNMLMVHILEPIQTYHIVLYLQEMITSKDNAELQHMAMERQLNQIRMIPMETRDKIHLNLQCNIFN